VTRFCWLMNRPRGHFAKLHMLHMSQHSRPIWGRLGAFRVQDFIYLFYIQPTEGNHMEYVELALWAGNLGKD
jgi:hypothetical protein